MVTHFGLCTLTCPELILRSQSALYTAMRENLMMLVVINYSAYVIQHHINSPVSVV